ncbi:MAG: hypothetical protein A3H28_08960 [Acidobacteria bacterium RIFCSPLOWO2_02_FULL_61_28]|nr:MAG: hypothetical protein A3H28_08960 [Acidobacteria bacterium RIFCSPLOWO2_02_FULL_61_28]
MADNVHFRCTFDVQPTIQSGVGFSELVGEIARWIRTKEGPSFDLDPTWMLKAGGGRRPDGKAVVTVDSLSESAETSKVDFWALRYDHQDAEFSPRRWFIDFGIVRTEPNNWRLATTVGNSLHPSYLGKEPGHLPATPPRVIKDLVSSSRFRCYAGSTELRGAPCVVQVGQADQLVRAIEDRGRACPLVYVSRTRLTGEPMIDPARLATTIVGAGVVYLAANTEVDEELEFLMVPREFRSPNGTVRVYAPGADFSLPQQAYRHRFFTRIQIEELTAAEVEGQIARALTRRQGWASVRSPVTSIDDIATRRRELRRATLQSQTDAASRDELLKLFEDENVRLSREVGTLTTDKEAIDQDVAERDMQIDELREALRRTEYESDYFRKDSEKARRELSAVTHAAEAARTIRQLPSSVADVVGLIERLHGDSVVFTDSARESAAASTLDDPAIAWECLHAAATVLPHLAFQIDGADLSQEFQNQTGFELSLTEGKLTKKDSKFADLRKVTFEGHEWDISAHIKHGVKAPKCLRVYFVSALT